MLKIKWPEPEMVAMAVFPSVCIGQGWMFAHQAHLIREHGFPSLFSADVNSWLALGCVVMGIVATVALPFSLRSNRT